MASIRFGFRDARTSAELMLAPGRPLSVSVLSGGNIKLGPFSVDAIGAISAAAGAAGLSPATFTRFRAQLESKAQIKALGASINASLSAYNNATQLILQGHTTLRDVSVFGTASLTPSSVTGAVTTFFNVNDLVQLSGLPVGDFASVSVRSAAAAQFAAREAQLTAFAGSITAAASNFKFFGAQIKENFNRQPRPTDDELDAPSTPALARGGDAAEQDTARRTKRETAVDGIKTAAGKPKSWARHLATLKEPLRSFKLNPGFSSVTNMVFSVDKVSQGSEDQPLATFNPQFPYNKITVSESGHIDERDDTPGAERINIQHRNGSYIEIGKEFLVYHSTGGSYTVTHGDHVIDVRGKCKIHVHGDASVYVEGNINVQGEKDMNIHVPNGEFNVHAANINLMASRTSKIDGTTIDLRYVKLPGVPVMTTTGMAPRLIAGALKADYPEPTAKIAAQMAVDRKLSAAYRKRVLAKLATAVTAAGVALAVRDMLRLTEYTQFGSFSPNIKWPALKQPLVVTEPPRTNPLSNPLIYSTKSDAARAYRGRLFDTPGEVNNIELYQAHIDTRRELQDIAETGIAIPGEKTTPTLSRVKRTVPRAISYPNRDAFRNVRVSPGVRLGNSSFTLGDVVDVFHSPDVANFITDPVTLTDAYRDPVTGDVTLPPETGGAASGPSAPLTNVGLSQPVFALLERMIAAYPLPLGADERVDELSREWMDRWTQQLRYTFPKGHPDYPCQTEYGHKRATPDRPRSADAMALKNGSQLLYWDMFSVGTGRLAISAGSRAGDISDQTFIPVSPVNHLGAVGEPYPGYGPCVGGADSTGVDTTPTGCRGTRVANGYDYLGSCDQACAPGSDGCGDYATEYDCISQNGCY